MVLINAIFFISLFVGILIAISLYFLNKPTLTVKSFPHLVENSNNTIRRKNVCKKFLKDNGFSFEVLGLNVYYVVYKSEDFFSIAYYGEDFDKVFFHQLTERQLASLFLPTLKGYVNGEVLNMKIDNDVELIKSIYINKFII
jgi:hypothetical protein